MVNRYDRLKKSQDLFSAMKLRADNVVILPDEPEEEGGIILSGKKDIDSKFGLIVKCGPGAESENSLFKPMFFKPGQRVVHDIYAGEVVFVDGVRHIVCSQEQVYGYFDDANDFDPRNIKAAFDWIYVDWEFAKSTYDTVGNIAVAPIYTEMHYTGIVLSKGPEVDDSVSVGDRILFDRFSRLRKIEYMDKRYALFNFRFAMSVIPYRTEVGAPND